MNKEKPVFNILHMATIIFGSGRGGSLSELQRIFLPTRTRSIKYSFLEDFSGAMQISGMLIFLSSIIAALTYFFVCVFISSSPLSVLLNSLLIILGGCISATLFIAIGDLIQLFIDIEFNTKR